MKRSRATIRFLIEAHKKVQAVYSAADGKLQPLAELSEEFGRMRNKKREGNEAFSQQNAELNDPRHRTAIVHYNGKCKPWLDGYKGELSCFYPPVDEKGPAPSGVVRKYIKSFLNITKLTKQQAIVAVGALVFVLLCLISYATFGTELLKILADPETFRAWLEQFGVFDELIFILIRAAQTIVKFIPAEPLEIASGYAWGAVPGMLYCMIGSMIGTLAIFALTKRYGKKIIDLFLPVKNMRLMTVFEGSNKIYLLLFFLYLIPGSPKDGFTYFVGLLPVKLLPFIVITFIARMPSVLLSTICGSTLAEKQYWIAVLIFVATIILAIVGSAIYNYYAQKKERQNKGANLSAK